MNSSLNLIESNSINDIINFDLGDINLIFNSNKNTLEDIKLKKRKRQNEINMASKRCRLKKKKQMEIMSEHINKMHEILLSNDNYDDKESKLLSEMFLFNINVDIKF